MPIDKKKTKGNIIKELMHKWKKTGKIGTSSPKNKKDALAQASAIAYSVKESKGIKKLLVLSEMILDEDFLSLQDQLIEIGVLTYLVQTGQLNSNRKKMLRQHIEEATEDIKQVIIKWLFMHGLVKLAESLDGSLEDYLEENDNTHSYLLKDIFNAIVEDWWSPELIKNINSSLGGLNFFGELDEDTIKDAFSPYIEEEEDLDPEGEDEPTIRSYFSGDESDLAMIFTKLKGIQVQNDDGFVGLAEEFVENIKNVEESLNIDPTKQLVTKFDRLKDLSHYNGNLIGDYGDVDWEDVNKSIEQKVKAMSNKVSV